MKNEKVKYCALTTVSGSLESFVLPSVIYLSANGYDVTVGCNNDEEFAKSLPVEIKFFPLDIERGYNLKKTIKTIGRLYTFFKKEKIEMVEYGTENVSFCGAIAAWLARVPVRIYNHWGSRYVGFTGINRCISLNIERTIALFSTDIRQQSKKNMELCVLDHVYPAKKVKVIGFGGTVGADFTRFNIFLREKYNKEIREKYNIPMDAVVYGDIGSIRKDKGSNELIEAFGKLNNDNAWLMLIGDIYNEDAPNPHLLEWAKNNKRIVFTGRVTEVERYVSAFTCIVHPSYREGLGMVLQEAGAMGVPYIATDIPGPSEFGIEGETGLLVEKGNADELKDKMEYLLEHPDIVLCMSKAIYRLTKERYERGIMIDRILEDRNLLCHKIQK